MDGEATRGIEHNGVRVYPNAGVSHSSRKGTTRMKQRHVSSTIRRVQQFISHVLHLNKSILTIFVQFPFFNSVFIFPISGTAVFAHSSYSLVRWLSLRLYSRVLVTLVPSSWYSSIEPFGGNSFMAIDILVSFDSVLYILFVLGQYYHGYYSRHLTWQPRGVDLAMHNRKAKKPILQPSGGHHPSYSVDTGWQI